MFIDWIMVAGSGIVYFAALLQTAEALRKPWAWLTIAKKLDSKNYHAATDAKWRRQPLARAIGGVADSSTLPWVPSSVQLDEYNFRAWNWLLMAIGSLFVAMSSSMSAMGLYTQEEIVGAKYYNFIPTIVACALVAISAIISAVNAKDERAKAVHAFNNSGCEKPI